MGSWWLARTYKRKTRRGKSVRVYSKLAWMESEIVGDRIEIRVVDLDKELGSRAVKKAKVERRKVLSRRHKPSKAKVAG